MKNKYLASLLSICLITFISYSQDSLLDELDKNIPSEQSSDGKVLNTFGSLRVINVQSVETMPKNSLMFLIQHRFGAVSEGFQFLYGLDTANIRLSLAYGVTDHITVELGRDKFNATYDGIVKWRFLQQSNAMPITATFIGTIAANGLKNDNLYKDNFSRRLSYTGQLLISRKFKNLFSLQVAPGFIHRNYVLSNDYDNLNFHIGFAARVRLSKSVYFIADYVQLINKEEENLENPLGLGIEIASGSGHAFQLHFTNAQPLHENGFIQSNTTAFTGDNLRFGFNISRIFWF